jgi:hypothetical protein
MSDALRGLATEATADPANILAGFVPEPVFAEQAKISLRTSARYRTQPDGLPYMMFGGRVYIPLAEAREWLIGRVRRPNQRRRAA